MPRLRTAERDPCMQAGAAEQRQLHQLARRRLHCMASAGCACAWVRLAAPHECRHNALAQGQLVREQRYLGHRELTCSVGVHANGRCDGDSSSLNPAAHVLSRSVFATTGLDDCKLWHVTSSQPAFSVQVQGVKLGAMPAAEHARMQTRCRTARLMPGDPLILLTLTKGALHCVRGRRALPWHSVTLRKQTACGCGICGRPASAANTWTPRLRLLLGCRPLPPLPWLHPRRLLPHPGRWVWLRAWERGGCARRSQRAWRRWAVAGAVACGCAA